MPIIGKAVTARRPKTCHVKDLGARPLITLRRILPDRAVDSAISRSLGGTGWVFPVC